MSNNYLEKEAFKTAFASLVGFETLLGLVDIIVNEYLYWECHCIFYVEAVHGPVTTIDCNVDVETVHELLQKVALKSNVPLDRIRLWWGANCVSSIYSEEVLLKTLGVRNEWSFHLTSC
jgi:hypothetical protein